MAGFKKASFNNLTPELQDKLSSLAEGGFLKKDLERQQKNFAETPLDQDFFNSLMKPVSQESNPAQAQPKEMSPIVKDYLSKKIQEKKNSTQREPAVNSAIETAAQPTQPEQKQPSFMDKFSDEERQKALDASYEDNGAMAIAQFFGGLGDTLAGRSPAETAKAFANYRAQQKDNNLGEFDRSKEAAVKDYSTKRSIEQNQMTDAQRVRDMDVNSEESKMARQLAVKMGMNPEVAKNLTAAKFKETSPVLEKMYAVEQNRLARQDAAALRSDARDAARAEKARLSDGQLKEVQEFDDTINKVQNAITTLGNNSNWTGSVDGRVPDMMVGSDQVAFRADIGRLSDAYRKLITGAGASNTELRKLESRLPSETDTFADFKAKAMALLQETQRAKNSHLKNLAYNGKNVEPFISAQSQQQSGNDPRIDNFMKKNGISDRNEAIKILKEAGKI